MPIKTGLLCVPTYDEHALATVRAMLAAAVPGLVVVQEQAAPMQRNMVENILYRWCDEEELDLVVTIGGTLPAPGPSGREIVPTATLAVAERQLPGLAESMRALAQETLPLSIIDSSAAAIRGRTLLLNLPAGGAAAVFLEGAVDVIGAVVAHLQDDPAAPSLAREETETDEEPKSPAAKGGLNAEAFAAFLKRDRGQ